MSFEINDVAQDFDPDSYTPKTKQIKYRPYKKIVKSDAPLNYEQTMKKAVNILNVCSKTRAQLFASLLAHGGRADIVDEVLDRLEETKLIDDTLIAKDYIYNAINLKKTGPKAVKYKLREKGIDDAIIEEVLEDYTYELQVEVACEIAEKKLRLIRSKNSYEKRQKLYTFLSSKGFSYSVINSVIESVVEDDWQE